MLQKYELLTIIKPESFSETEKKIVEFLKKQLGDKAIEKKEDLGKKTLVYPIKKMKEGNYYLFTLSCDSEKILEVSAKLKTFESIVRFLLVKKK